MTSGTTVTYREVMTDTPEPKTPLSPPNEPADESPRRLQRSSDAKVIAGVARGLGNRFDIDANIFRVIFVVLTLFWGLGVAIYLALWVFVPQAEGEEVTRVRPPVSKSHRLSVAVLAGVLVLALLLAAITHGGSMAHRGPSLALVWLVFLVALSVVALRTPARRLSVRRVFAVAFLVALSGAILVVGAVMGFVASTGVALSGGVGAHTWQPTTLRQVQHRYETEFGATTLNLQAVTFPSTGYVIDVSTAIGSVWVCVPANAVVSITTHVGLGPVYLQGSPDGSPFTAIPATRGGVGAHSLAPHLTIDARVGIGRIDIVRASRSTPRIS